MGIGVYRTLLMVAVGLAAICAAAPAALASSTTYVDCGATPAGADGSSAHPLTTLAEASAVGLEPGSELLFRRGSSCSGTLELTGGGSEQAPALVSAYGNGEAPRIEATDADGITLLNTSHVTVEELDVANPGDGSEKKRGVHLIADGETVRGVVVRKLQIHDVGGNLDKDRGGSGGVQVDATGSTGRFNGLLIEDNQISDTSRSGIFVYGVAGGDRPRATEPWPEASIGVRILGNRLERLQGDGIVALGTDGAYIAHNLVTDGNLGGRGLTDPEGMICNAGIWTFNANNTKIEHNEVARMRFNGCDGSGFDIDYEQDGTIVQSNYSHDNEGGFMLLCTDDEPRASEVRFNLSVNDGFSFTSSPCGRPAGSYEGVRIYNNTIVAPDPGVGILGNETGALYGPASLELFNNAFVATDSGRGFTCEPECHDNLFSGMPAAGSDATSAEPGFVGDGPYGASTPPEDFKLTPHSAAYGTGAPIPAGAGRDYFGTRIDAERAPNIGFWQGRRARARVARVGRHVRLRAGGSRRLVVKLRNRGDATASGLRLCARLGAAARRKLRAPRCARLDALDQRSSERIAIRLRARRGPAARGIARLRLRLRTADAGSDARRVLVRVRH